MPRITFSVVIAESEAELHERERNHRDRRTHARVQMLRLLKTGEVRSLLAVAPLVGYSVRQVSRWWQIYRTEGLDALLQVRPRPGKPSRLTDEARRDLEVAMAQGEIATIRDAQRYLRAHWQIEYRSLNGVWLQLRKYKMRPKTGRRRHRQADPATQQRYKRDVPHYARAPGLSASLGL